MIKDINIRVNLDKEEHKKAWDYMQTMEIGKVAEKEDNHLPKISEDLLDALEDLF